jgi:hypothetical protein
MLPTPPAIIAENQYKKTAIKNNLAFTNIGKVQKMFVSHLQWQ